MTPESQNPRPTIPNQQTLNRDAVMSLPDIRSSALEVLVMRIHFRNPQPQTLALNPDKTQA